MKSVEPICSVSSPEATRRRGQERRHESAAQPMLALFERLAKALYAVRRLCPDLPVLAIPWMHPKHPVHPVQKKLIQGERAISSVFGKFLTVCTLVWRIGRCTAYVMYLSCRLVRLRLAFRREIAALRLREFDLVAKTWCLRSRPSTDNDDFYYGDLQRRLAERGVRMLLLCGDANVGGAFFDHFR